MLQVGAASAQSTDGPPADPAPDDAGRVYLPLLSQEAGNDGAGAVLGADDGSGGIDGTWSLPRNDIGDHPVTCEYLANSPNNLNDENQVRYGQPYGLTNCGDSNLRSGFGFDGVNQLEFAPGEVFLLGQFTHYNENILPASVPLDLVDLTVQLSFASLPLSVDLGFTLQLDETANNRKPCPYGATTDGLCDDKTDFINNTPQQVFTVDDKIYTLEIVGFVPGTAANCQYEASTVDYFITAEKQRNDACIFARIIEPAPAIQVTKEPELQTIAAGDSAEFTVTVQNIGNVGLGQVVVADPLTEDCVREVGDMKAGAVTSFACTGYYIERDFENIATATGLFAGVPFSATDNALVDVLAPDTASVRVFKYADLNADGARGDGEPGLAGWKMCLRDADDNPVGLCQETGADGSAVLAGNTTGDFAVCEELQTGWTNSDPGGGSLCKPVTLVDGPLYAEPSPAPGDIYGVELVERSSDLLSWTYAVYQFDGSTTLGRWMLELPPCITAEQIDPDGTTPGYIFGIDDAAGGSGLQGIYWDTPEGVDSLGTPFQLRFKQVFDVGASQASTTQGVDAISAVEPVAGPVCTAPVLLGNVADRTPRGQLELRVEINPATDAGRFDLTIDGTPFAGAAANGGTTGKQEVAPGVHTVAALAAAGTEQADYTSSAHCTEAHSGATWAPDEQGRVLVQDEEDVVCTIRYIRKGTIAVVKATGGALAAGEWQYAGTLGAFTLPAAGGEVRFERLVQGTYQVVESSMSGWVLDELACTDPDGDTTVDRLAGSASIDLDPGENIVCTFTSSTQTGSVTIAKLVEGTASDDWQFDGTLNAFALPAGGGARTFGNLPAGPYTIAEQARPDWYVPSLVCVDPDGGSAVDAFNARAVAEVDPGEAIVCTFTNRYGPPAIELDKSASAATVYPNAVVTYTFTALNSGQMPLINTAVDDPLCSVMPVIAGVRNAGDSNSDGVHDPGESWLFTCALTIVADTYNTATVTAVAPSGQRVSDSDDATVKVVIPTITISKKASRTAIYRNQSVDYTITIRNVGNVPLTSVVVEDGMPACQLAARSLGNGDNVLGRGEKWVFACTAVLTEDTVNTATVTAVDPNGQVMTAEASAEVDVIQPNIKIEKTVDKAFAYPGERVVFTLRVLNLGDTPLTNVVVKDSLPQCKLSSPLGDQGDDRILAPGEQWFLSCTVPVCEKTTQGTALAEGEVAGACVPDELCDDFTNTATVTAKDRFGKTWKDTDQVRVEVIHPSIKVTKQVDKAVIKAGERVKFTIGVDNNGDVELTNVALNESLPACVLNVPTGDDEDGWLDPDETWYYTCAMTLTQSITNTVTVEAFDPNGKKASGSASVAVKVNPVNLPCVDVPGGTLTWVKPNGGPLKVYMFPTGSNQPRGLDAYVAKIDLGYGQSSYGFCMNAEQGASSTPYCLEGGVSDCRVAYLLSKYPPSVTDAAVHAGRQAAVWHYTNGYNLNLDNPTASNDVAVEKVVRDTYLAVVADVDKYAGDGNLCTPGDVGVEVTPPSAVNELPLQPDHPFTVKLTKGGKPLAGYIVTVSADFGTLNPMTATTDAAGEANFTISSPVTGTATITATATVLVPTSQRFAYRPQPQTRQPIGIPGSQTITVVGRANKTWIMGPGATAVICEHGDTVCDPGAGDIVDDAANHTYLPLMRR